MSVQTKMAVLYSEPLVMYGPNREIQWVGERLDFEAEKRVILDSLREAARQIEIRFEAATADNLRTLVTLGYSVLHYSGHGHPDFLAFECSGGETHPMSSSTLKMLFAAGGTTSVKFAFVSACHSRSAGEAFVTAGVPHVVCVMREEPVYDVAARVFARALYLALGCGKTVKAAFDIATAAVSASPDVPDAGHEAGKFLLLPEGANHDVPVYMDVVGPLVDATPHAGPKQLPVTPKHFSGRSVDVQIVASLLLSERLVTLLGPPGIGKTALSLAAANYLYSRRPFPDGVFFVSLRDTKSADAVRTQLCASLGIGTIEEGALTEWLSHRTCLLVLDNLEDPLRTSPGLVRQLLSKVLEAGSGVKVLTTTRQPVGGGIQGVPEIIHRVKRLSPLDTSDLLIRLSPRSLSPEEVGTSQYEAMRHALSRHPLISTLSGHPHAIALVAALLRDRSIGQVYQKLRNQQVDALAVEGIPDDELDSVTSFSRSLQVSVDYLAEVSPESVRLFSMMGLLPSGVLGPDLAELWGRSGVELMETLVLHCLVEKKVVQGVDHFSTFPFVTWFAQRLMSPEDRLPFEESTGRSLALFLLNVVKSLGTVQAKVAIGWLELMEANYWAYLERLQESSSELVTDDRQHAEAIASMFPQALLWADRIRDGANAAKFARDICRKRLWHYGEANALFSLADLQVRLGDDDGAVESFSEALDLYRTLGKRPQEATTLQERAEILIRKGLIESARKDLGSALFIFKGLNDPHGVMLCTIYLGKCRMMQGRYTAALRLLSRAFNRLWEGGYLSDSAAAVSYMAGVANRCGLPEYAVCLALHSQDIHDQIEDQTGQLLDLCELAQGLLQLGAYGACYMALLQGKTILAKLHASSASVDDLVAQLEEVADCGQLSQLAENDLEGLWNAYEGALQQIASKARGQKSLDAVLNALREA